MYQPRVNSTGISTTLEDSKYTVAELLSSLANGDPVTPTSLAFMSSGVPTGTTPTLTPTTLQSLETAFATATAEINNGTATTSVLGNSQRVSGFVPPLIDPVVTSAQTGSAISMVKQEFPDWYNDDSSLSEDPDWAPTSAAKRARVAGQMAPSAIVVRPGYEATAGAYSMGGHGATGTPATTKRTPGPRRYRDEYSHLSPEEADRRRVRRERNKMAAAKCRQRRVDLTNTLINETDGLEDEQAKLEQDIHNLEQQKEQLEFLLEAHRPVCTAKGHLIAAQVKAERPPAAVSAVTTASTAPFVQPELTLPATATTLAPSVLISLAHSSGAMTSRPNTLPIFSGGVSAASSSALPEMMGVAITTPSGGLPVYTLGLDCMVDGHTGLTPITGAPSCASQVQRTTSDTSSSSTSESLSSPTTLMAL